MVGTPNDPLSQFFIFHRHYLRQIVIYLIPNHSHDHILSILSKKNVTKHMKRSTSSRVGEGRDGRVRESAAPAPRPSSLGLLREPGAGIPVIVGHLVADPRRF